MNCDIIQDLLILYEDDACSPASKAAVETHLEHCADCRQRRALLHPALPALPVQEKKTMRRAFRRVRRRWIASIFAVLMLLPLFQLGRMIKNEYNREGVNFSNLALVLQIRGYLRDLAQEDFSSAVSQLNFSVAYTDIQGALALQPEDHLSERRIITIGGEPYRVTDSVSQYVQQSNPMDLWEDLICQDIPGILIPEAVFFEVFPQAEAQQTMDGRTTYSVEDGFIVCTLYKTQWGNFLLSPSSWSKLDGQQLTVTELYHFMDLVPEQLHQAVLPDLKQEAQANYQWVQEYYGSLIGMSLEEYDALMESRCLDRLQQMSDQGIRLQSYRFDSAWLIDQQWHIRYDLTFETPAGQQEICMDFVGSTHGLSVSTIQYANDHGYVADIHQFLSTRFAP